VSDAALLSLAGADFGYAGRAVVRGATLAVRPNEFVVLLGSNGSGKTTLLRGLLGFLPPLAGSVRTRAGLRIGYVPQRETLDPLYPLSGFDVALLGAWRDLPFWRLSGRRERARARAALDACRATDFATRLKAQGRPDDARALLQPVFDQFTEGRETADLQAAEQLLTA